MAEAQKLSVRPRVVLGKKVNALRRKGLLPGVVFGGKASSTPVEMDQHTFELGYRRWGNTTLLSLTGLGGEVPALIYDVSRDPVSGRMLHVDFARVSLTEKTHADVPLHFTKESPAVKSVGAVLLHALSEVTVEAFPQDMPRTIEVDLSGLVEIDDSIFVRDLKVDATVIQITNDPDGLVVKVVPARVEEEKPAEVAAPAEGEAAVEGEAAPVAAGAEAAKAAPAEAAKPGAAKAPAGGGAKAPAAGAPKPPPAGGAKKA